ncbi:MAG: nucleotide-binding domain-containing protein [Mycobacterium sp.]
MLGSRRNNLLLHQRVVARGRKLQFHLRTDAPEPYEVLWKIRNRGTEAAQIPGELRGQIRKGGNKSRNIHEESTKYRGSHYVEAYVVRDGIVVASDSDVYANKRIYGLGVIHVGCASSNGPYQLPFRIGHQQGPELRICNED